MTDNKQNDAIRSLLRRGDPAGGVPLDAEGVEHMRRRVLAEARRGRSLRSVLAVAVAQGWYRRAMIGVSTAAFVVLIAAAIVWRERPEPAAAVAHRPPDSASPGANVDSAVMPADLRPARTIHFVTPSGTRVIWTLDPNFNLYPDEAPSRS